MKDHHFVCSLCTYVFFYVYKVEYCKFYMFIVYYCIVAFIGSQPRSDTLAFNSTALFRIRDLEASWNRKRLEKNSFTQIRIIGYNITCDGVAYWGVD